MGLEPDPPAWIPAGPMLIEAPARVLKTDLTGAICVRAQHAPLPPRGDSHTQGPKTPVIRALPAIHARDIGRRAWQGLLKRFPA